MWSDSISILDPFEAVRKALEKEEPDNEQIEAEFETIHEFLVLLDTRLKRSKSTSNKLILKIRTYGKQGVYDSTE
jgi:hypothetical protein